jgi:hypothetical protein
VNKPRIVAVMPVKGREELFGITIKRLYQQRDVEMTVVCIGHTHEEWEVTNDNGGIFIMMPNDTPLGAKWQRGIDEAAYIDPDAVMIVGSGNWFTNGWCGNLFPLLEEFDVVGSEEMYIYHIRQKDRIMLHWGGYYTSRRGDMLGAGRMISKRILDKVNWQIYDTSLNKGLDKSMTRILKKAGAEFYTAPPTERILKVSSYKWENINPFTALWNSPRCKKVEYPDEILKYFPEAKTLLA